MASPWSGSATFEGGAEMTPGVNWGREAAAGEGPEASIGDSLSGKEGGEGQGGRDGEMGGRGGRRGPRRPHRGVTFHVSPWGDETKVGLSLSPNN